MSSILDVAKKAGVSASTVARVINQHPRVSPDTKTRVQRAMKTLGYTPLPPQLRRGPRTKVNQGFRTRNIAKLLIAMDPSQLKTQLTMGPIAQVLAEHGLNLLLVPMPDPDKLPPIIDLKQIDGVIIQGKDPEGSAKKTLLQIPSIWMLTRRSENLPVDSVEPDNRANGRMAAQYLQGRGHQHLAIFCLNPNYPAFRQRYDSFVETAKAADCIISEPAENLTEPAPILETHPPSQVIGEAQMQQILDQDPRPTGIYVLSKAVPTVYRILEQQGLQPGKDIDIIVGDYNPDTVELLHPVPACIDSQLNEIARRTVEQLLWRIRHPSQAGPVRTLMPPQLVAPSI